MKKALTIVARIEARKDRVELVKEELLKLVSHTRKEEGCIQYDLHQDNEQPEVFIFYENWVSRDLWLRHMSSPHIAAYAKATQGCVTGFVLNEMTRII